MKWLLAAGAGVLWALQFGREPHTVASWLALAPLILLLSTTRASGRLAFVFGFVSWLTALSWIVPTLVTYGGMPEPMAWPLTALLASYLAAFDAVFGWIGGKVWRRWGTAARLLVLPSLWVALEWLRTYLFGGFPWNLAAYAWVDVAGALPLSAWIGPYGISFLVVLASAGAAAAVQRRRWEPLAVAWSVPLLLLPMAGRWSLQEGMEALHGYSDGSILGHEGLPVRLLQPNIANLTEYDAVAVLRNYRKVMEASVQACQPGSLVIWPESAAWPLSYAQDATLRQDLDALVKRGCTVLFNSSHPVEESFYNSAYLLSPQGNVHRYDKRHLVPFGEYIPFRGLFSWMDKLARNAGDFRAAAGLTLLPWEREKLGMAICYEVVYPAEVAELARRGATVLVTITNDAWYGDTWAPWQHYRAARFRAAENRRPLLRAAITGVSAVVGPDGAVWSQLGVFKDGVIRARVLGRKDLTFYARHPSLVPLLASIVSVAAVAIYFARKEKKTS